VLYRPVGDAARLIIDYHVGTTPRALAPRVMAWRVPVKRPPRQGLVPVTLVAWRDATMSQARWERWSPATKSRSDWQALPRTAKAAKERSTPMIDLAHCRALDGAIPAGDASLRPARRGHRRPDGNSIGAMSATPRRASNA
jgi:hypothetical protein